ncbi:MAG: rRNA pseudouridine synthase [Oscillospiraceae bacterium]|nr:rRNA pseudouridine synthase [Oscillospiraceae bacterium]
MRGARRTEPGGGTTVGKSDGGAIRLDKLLADTGRWTRREAKELLRRGRVTVDGSVERDGARKVCAGECQVAVDGQIVSWQRFRYLLLHKPAGVLTATEDKRQRTVLDLLPPEDRDLFPVGRLDKDTTGLLLLTDDGALAHRLLSPKYHVDKVYEAEIEGDVDAADVAAFAAGMTLSDGTPCLPAGLERLGEGRCRVTLREGKFHQVKRMLAQRGHPVTSLHRVAMGALTLDPSLEAGGFRELAAEEVAALKGE